MLSNLRFAKYKQATHDSGEITNMVEVSLRKKLELGIQYVDEHGVMTQRFIEPLYIDEYNNVRAYDWMKGYRSFKLSGIKCAFWTGKIFSRKGRKIPKLNKNYRVIV
jgi:predicted DNA-binding transcriptional regulator YafY